MITLIGRHLSSRPRAKIASIMRLACSRLIMLVMPPALCGGRLWFTPRENSPRRHGVRRDRRIFNRARSAFSALRDEISSQLTKQRRRQLRAIFVGQRIVGTEHFKNLHHRLARAVDPLTDK